MQKLQVSFRLNELQDLYELASENSVAINHACNDLLKHYFEEEMKDWLHVLNLIIDD